MNALHTDICSKSEPGYSYKVYSYKEKSVYVGHGGEKNLFIPIVGMTVTFDKTVKMSRVGQMSDIFLHFVDMASMESMFWYYAETIVFKQYNYALFP